jgi:hypothetical protein
MSRTRIHHFDGFSIKKSGIDIQLDMDRVSDNFNRAQFSLDSAVMTSMEPFMPKDTGQFINVTKEMSAAMAGTGKVVAAAPPQGRFLYEGKVMVGERSRSAWAKKGEKKVVTKNNLQYSRGGPRWFDKAKQKDGDNWVDLVKKTAGGGK